MSVPALDSQTEPRPAPSQGAEPAAPLRPAPLWLPPRGPLGLLPLLFLPLAAGVTVLALYSPLAAAGLLYVSAFLLAAWRWPAVALVLIFASAPFQNDLSGGGAAKFSIAEVNLTLTLPLLYARWLVTRRSPHVGPILVPVLLYFGVCLVSSLIHWQGSEAVLSLFQMFLYMIVVVAVFCSFGTDPRQYLPALNTLVWVGVFLAVAGLATGYWFISLNKNGIADSLTCSFLVCVELILSAQTARRRNVLLGALLVIAVGLLFSLSRGAWLGTLGGVIFIFALRRQFRRLLLISLMLLPLLALFWFTLPRASREYAVGFGQDHYNIKLRYDSLELAQSYFIESPVYGMGVGLRKGYDATNVLLMAAAETGLLGVAGFLLIHAAFFRMIWKTQARLSPTETLFSFLCIGGAMVLSKFLHGLVDHYWSRGALMVAWASAGMATQAYYAAMGRPRLPAAGSHWADSGMRKVP